MQHNSIIHCLTGCDNTASFFVIGKKRTFYVLKEKKEHLLFVNELGDTPLLDVNSSCVKDALRFICWLYDPNVCNFNINKL